MSRARTSIWAVHPLRSLLLLLGSLAAPLSLEACGGHRPASHVPDDPHFEDYTTRRIESLAEFRQLAAVPARVDDRPAIAGAKFVITSFSDPARRRIHYLD